jgi:hypothetical protein
MQHAIYVLLKVDHTARMAQVGKSIVTNLAVGNVHEAFPPPERVVSGGHGNPSPAMFSDHGKADGGVR